MHIIITRSSEILPLRHLSDFYRGTVCAVGGEREAVPPPPRHYIPRVGRGAGEECLGTKSERSHPVPQDSGCDLSEGS